MEYLKVYEGSTILVTGGAGAIGSNLCKKLSEAGAKLIIVLDDLSSGHAWNITNYGTAGERMPTAINNSQHATPSGDNSAVCNNSQHATPSRDNPAAVCNNVMFVRGSVTDDIMLKRVFFERPSFVFHLAAFFANQNSVDYPEKDININGLGTLKMLEYAMLNKVERFIYASSGCSVYGNTQIFPLREEFMSMHLSTPYQITKMLGELYCNFFNNHYNLPVVKARFFNSYGPGEVPGQYRNVIPNFIYWALKGQPLPITGSGEETRDFTYVGDLVDGLLRSGYYKEALGQEFNLASGVEIKIIELANMINEITSNKAGVKFVQRRKWDTKSRLLASTDKARKLINYQPSVDFTNGLNRTILWFRENWKQIENSVSFGPGVSSAVRDKDV